MRKSSPFVAIPTVPTTLSGQWLTFSHMANHYRKLLNVKPRVQTNAPMRPSAVALQPSQKKTSKKPSKSQGSIKILKSSDGIVGLSNNTILNAQRKMSPGRKRSEKEKEYQLVFDQSELNNLSEAVMSDSDVERDEPNVRPMRISEKIKKYLDLLEDAEYDENESPSPISSSPYVKDFANLMKYGNFGPSSSSRHAKCFLPSEASPRPKPPISKLRLSQSQPSQHKTAIAKSSVVSKILKPSNEISKSNKKSLQSSHLKNKKENTRRNSYSPNSGSIGTVRGSDELMDGRFLSLLSQSAAKKEIASNKQNAARKCRREASPEWLSTKGNTTTTRLSSANRPKSSSISGVIGNGVNKDSSRDSAYGFSSGESGKITTRESTPEKRKSRKKVYVDGNGQQKYKSNLSTVASSVYQDSSANSFHHSEQKSKSNTSIKPNQDGESGGNWMTDKKYVNFITAVTEDIVTREIFTNKGLKSVFQSHVDANRDLDTDKMLYMLDRLRMDVGVPKEDSLNQMEFGYGSIKYSTGPFFVKALYQSMDNLPSETDINLKDKPSATHLPEDQPIQHQQHPTKKTVSDVTLLELHHRPPGEQQSADESSKMSSCSNSMHGEEEGQTNYNNKPEVEKSKDSTSPSSRSSDESYTESEFCRALGEVGFDKEETIEIVKIVKQGKERHKGKKKRKALRSSGIAIATTTEPNTTKYTWFV